MNDLVGELKARGLIEHTSAGLEKILGERRTVYLGVDPTSDSMQVGNLMVVLLMKRLQDAGHAIQFIVGGGTGMIGDPKASGERPLIDARAVAANKRALEAQFRQIMGRRVKVIDNADWLLKVKLVDFLRDIGKHFTVNELIKRDIIKRRLETENDSISYTEFAYGLLQGFDYLVLNQKYGTDLQIGASDQWTNILSGVELIRRKEGREAFALTTPLVVDAAGKKFGKSEGNAVWLDARKTSPYTFYQFWLNQPDSVVEQYLKFYTFLSLTEIEMLMEMHGREPGRREAQKALAREVTALVHGTQSAERSAGVSEVLFGDRSLDTLTRDERSLLMSEAPSIHATYGMSVVDALVSSGLASSKGDARRLIEGKGVSVNGVVVDSADQSISQDNFKSGVGLLKKGKQIAIFIEMK